MAVAALVLGAVGLGLGLTLGMRGFAGNEASGSAVVRQLLQANGPLVVFSEFGETADTIWATDPDDPKTRTQLARVEHAVGYGIVPSVSPDGAHVAYAVLPPGVSGGALTTNAELWVLEVASGKTKRLAEGIDLRTGPVWAPTGDAVVSRRGAWSEDAAGSFQLLRIDLAGAETTIAASESEFFPIDFSPDGSSLYYAAVSQTGTELARVPALGGEPEIVGRLADRWARDWHLSPDGTKLSYLGEPDGSAEVAFVAKILDLATGGVSTPLPRPGVAQFNPIWEPEGGLTVGRFDAASGGSAPVRFSAEGVARASGTLPPPALPAGYSGFDVPLSWSPDGVHLAVRSFTDASASDPGPSWLFVVGAGGARRQLSTQSDVIIAGWLEDSE